MRPEVLPAVLAKNLSEYIEKLSLLKTFAKKVHVDFVDGRFAKNKTILPYDLGSQDWPFSFVAHLMVEEPERYLRHLENWRLVFIHNEALAGRRALVKIGSSFPGKVGLALKPETTIDSIADFVLGLPAVLIMTVEPGFYGGDFLETSMKKIAQLRNLGFRGKIAVDGGMNSKRAKVAAEMGADQIVIGSAIFQAGDPKGAYQEIVETLAKLPSGLVKTEVSEIIE